MSLFHACVREENKKSLGFGCYYSGNGEMQTYEDFLFSNSENICDVCGFATADPLIHICTKNRKQVEKSRICSNCVIVVIQTNVHASDERTWDIQNHRTPLITCLLAITVLRDIKRHIIYTNGACVGDKEWTYEIRSEHKIEKTKCDLDIIVRHHGNHMYHVIGVYTHPFVFSRVASIALIYKNMKMCGASVC